MSTSKFDLEKIRKKMAQKVDGRKIDPFEFRAPKAKATEVIKYRFYILPELAKGDKVHGGTASRDMDLFVVKHGQHWINNRPHSCPRLFNDEECEMCSVGFEALNEIPKTDTDKRTAVRKQWLSSSVFAANIYFPPIDPNPEDLRGKVLWYNAPKQVFDLWYAALSRDDQGDTDDPEAFGVIYDPFNAFLFQLVVKSGGSYNEYKASKFIATAGAHPIVMLPNKRPDEAAITRILDSRHDLYTKIEIPNPAKIVQLCQSMLHGSDGSADEISPTTPEDVASDATPKDSKPTGGKRLPPVADDDDMADAPVKPAGKRPPPIDEADDVAGDEADAVIAEATASALADEMPVAVKQPVAPTKTAPVSAAKAKPAPAQKQPAAPTKMASASAPVTPAAKTPTKSPAAVEATAGDDGDGDDDDIQAILNSLKKGDTDD